MVRRVFGLFLASCATTLFIAVPAPPAFASSDGRVRITVTTTQGTVEAPGLLRWTVRITNLTAHSLANLRLAEQVSLAGDPGHGTTKPFAPGPCTAAAGTAYCPLPTLLPGRTISRNGSAEVVARLAPRGPSTIGSRVETLEFVSTAAGVVVSNQARVSVRIVRGGLPVTGDSTRLLAIVGLGCVIVGGLIAMIGARCPRRDESRL